MATFVVTIDVPASPTRAVELFYIDRGLEIAANMARSAGGQVLSGTMETDQFLALGSYVYTPTAPR